MGEAHLLDPAADPRFAPAAGGLPLADPFFSAFSVMSNRMLAGMVLRSKRDRALSGKGRMRLVWFEKPHRCESSCTQPGILARTLRAIVHKLCNNSFVFLMTV